MRLTGVGGTTLNFCATAEHFSVGNVRVKNQRYTWERATSFMLMAHWHRTFCNIMTWK